MDLVQRTHPGHFYGSAWQCRTGQNVQFVLKYFDLLPFLHNCFTLKFLESAGGFLLIIS